MQLGTILWAFWMLREPRRWRWGVPVALTISIEVCITTAASGILTRDLATTSLLFIIFTTATATFLPWGARPQLATVGVASLAVLWNTVALDLSAAAASYPAVAMILAFVTSVYIAWDSQRDQRERRQAEEIRRGTKLCEQLHFNDYLDKRSSDPTYTLRQHLRAIGGAIEE